MTLTEQLKELQALSAQKRWALQGIRDMQAFNTRVNELEATYNRWEPKYKLYREFKNRGICKSLNVQYAAALKSQLQSLKGSVNDGTYGTANEDPPNMRVFAELGPEFLDKLTSQLLQSWGTYLKTLEATAVGDRILEQYDYGVHSQTVNKLKILISNLRTQAGQLPQRVDMIEDVAKLAAAINEGVGTLPTDPLPDDVREFLSQAKTNEGASLALLTEDVLCWLKSHGADSMFQVRTH